MPFSYSGLHAATGPGDGDTTGLESAIEERAAIHTRAALGASDCRTLARAAHTLKGSLGNFAAGAACEASLRLEEAAQQGDLELAQQAWGQLVSEVGKVTAALEQVLGQT
jgi:HPt (histidine-containing phosphotransfer) domain-containing protein